MTAQTTTYGQRLAIAMDLAQVKRPSLAKTLGISNQALGAVLNGSSAAFSAENNAKAAMALGVDSNWLALGGSATPGKTPSTIAARCADLIDSLPSSSAKKIALAAVEGISKCLKNEP